MATSRTISPGQAPQRDVKLRRPKRLKRELSRTLGAKLARHVVAVARSRITAVALEIQVPAMNPEPEHGTQPMQDDTVRETLKRRWKSDRPYEGMSSEAIEKKLAVGALTDRAAGSAVQELNRRGYKVRPA